LKIHAIAPLGDLGDEQGLPAVINWTPRKPVFPLLFWSVIILVYFFIVSKNRAAWAIIIPAVIVHIPLSLLLVNDDLSFLFHIGSVQIISLCIICYISHFIGRRKHFLRFIIACLIFLLMGGCLARLINPEMRAMRIYGVLIYYAIIGLIILCSLTFAGLICRRKFSFLCYTIWTLFWIFVLPYGIVIYGIIIEGMRFFRFFGQIAMTLAVFSIVQFVLILPFIILLKKSNWYNRGFRGIFGIQENIEPLSTEKEVNQE